MMNKDDGSLKRAEINTGKIKHSVFEGKRQETTRGEKIQNIYNRREKRRG